MILAKQISESEVRYIELDRYQRDKVTPILRMFYTKEARATALIDLGNLYQLAPSPYGKHNHDKVHCCAHIRDMKHSRGKNSPKYATLSELAQLKGTKFLYKDGVWHFYNGKEFTIELPAVIPNTFTNRLEGLEIRSLGKDIHIESHRTENFESWADIIDYSNEKGKPIFIFRGNKLITTINHPKQTQL